MILNREGKDTDTRFPGTIDFLRQTSYAIGKQSSYPSISMRLGDRV